MGESFRLEDGEACSDRVYGRQQVRKGTALTAEA
jgi:hypothetical protein